MSSYVGNRSNDPLIDFMLDTIVDRGYTPESVDLAVERWNEGEGEDRFWTQHLGPTIDALERELLLTVNGLTKHNKKVAPIYHPDHDTGSRIVSATYFGGSPDDYVAPNKEDKDAPA